MPKDNSFVSPENNALPEMNPTAREFVTFCNYLGIEQVALDVDFNQPLPEIIDQLTLTVGLPLPEEDLFKPQDDNDLNRIIYRQLTELAIETFDERVSIPDSILEKRGIMATDENPQPCTLADYANSQMASLEKTRADLQQAETRYAASQNDTDYWYIKSLKKRMVDEQLQVFSDCMSIVQEIGFSGQYYSKSSEPSMLRADSPENQELNCISYTAAALSLLRHLGVNESDCRVFAAGPHIGLLARMNEDMYCFDPIGIKIVNPNEENANNQTSQKQKKLFLDDYHLTFSQSEQISTEDYFNNYSLVDKGLSTYKDFVQENNPLREVPANLRMHPVHFLPATDGIVSGLLTHQGFVDYERYDVEASSQYFQKALLFDPENDIARSCFESLEAEKV